MRELSTDIIPLEQDALHGVARSLVFPDATPAPPTKRGPIYGDAEQNAVTVPTKGTGDTPDKAIAVILRIRPLSDIEREENDDSCISIPQNKPTAVHIRPKDVSKHPASIRNAGKATFKFSKVFDDSATQSDVFEHAALPLIDGLFTGRSGVVFAYGVTCSGKTWTIQGNSECPGLLPRSLDVIINSIAVSKGRGLLQDTTVSDEVLELTSASYGHSNAGVATRTKRKRGNKGQAKVHDSNYLEVDGSIDYKLFASYLEIYNEQCYDLFEKPYPVVKEEKGCISTGDASVDAVSEHCSSEGTRESTQANLASHKSQRRILTLKEGGAADIYADGQTEVEIHSSADVDRLLEFGQENRSVARTNANEHSSRSHAVFMINLKQTEAVEQSKGAPKTLVRSSRLCIVDLAGSERTSRTNNSGKRLKEAAKINQSLMTLGHCLEVMRQNQIVATKNPSKKPKLVPFRQSRLTRLLQYSLGAGSAVMIANVSPTMQDADETIRVLRCAAVAGEVIAVQKKKANVLVDSTNLRSDRALRQTRSTAVTKGGTISRPRRKRREDGGNTEAVAERIRQLEKQLETQERSYSELYAETTQILKMSEEKDKDLAELRWQFDDIFLEKKAVDEENDKLWRENERFQDHIADMESRICTLRAEMREEISRETSAIMLEMQEKHRVQMQQVIEDSEAFANKKIQMMSVAEMQAKTSRVSLAVDQSVKNHFHTRGSGYSSDETEDLQHSEDPSAEEDELSCGEEDEDEYIEEDCGYIE